MAIARHFLASSAVMEDATVGSKVKARTADAPIKERFLRNEFIVVPS
jgi:hypothetical protein